MSFCWFHFRYIIPLAVNETVSLITSYSKMANPVDRLLFVKVTFAKYSWYMCYILIMMILLYSTMFFYYFKVVMEWVFTEIFTVKAIFHQFFNTRRGCVCTKECCTSVNGGLFCFQAIHTLASPLNYIKIVLKISLNILLLFASI